MITGRIRRRLLVNAFVDPDEAATRLPRGLRPHVTVDGTVIGCCLLELTRLRPAGMPSAIGVGMRAAAHRISAEWDDPDSGETVVGVFVPERLTDSRIAVGVGGRWFPGVHRPAKFSVGGADDQQVWRVTTGRALGIAVTAVPEDGTRSASPATPATHQVVAATCVGAAIGVSPTRAGGLEAARMDLDDRRVSRYRIEEIDSPYIDGFRSAVIAPALLMQDVAVNWHRAAPPTPTAHLAAL